MIKDVLVNYLREHTIKELMEIVLEAIKESGRSN